MRQCCMVIGRCRRITDGVLLAVKRKQVDKEHTRQHVLEEFAALRKVEGLEGFVQVVAAFKWDHVGQPNIYLVMQCAPTLPPTLCSNASRL